jgi:hypothetical protein
MDPAIPDFIATEARFEIFHYGVGHLRQIQLSCDEGTGRDNE